MDITNCILEIYPDWNGVVWSNSYEGIKPDAAETRPTPTLAELEAVWPKVEAEQIIIRKRQVYKAESDPIYAEWQALLTAGHPDAETRHQEWLDKRAEIKARVG